jgi:hypothetical protein
MLEKYSRNALAIKEAYDQMMKVIYIIKIYNIVFRIRTFY